MLEYFGSVGRLQERMLRAPPNINQTLLDRGHRLRQAVASADRGRFTGGVSMSSRLRHLVRRFLGRSRPEEPRSRVGTRSVVRRLPVTPPLTRGRFQGAEMKLHVPVRSRGLLLAVGPMR